MVIGPTVRPPRLPASRSTRGRAGGSMPSLACDPLVGGCVGVWVGKWVSGRVSG
jgi:hypothetical protein